MPYCKESNLARLTSQTNRSARLFRAACANFRASPSLPARQRRADRGRAYVAVRAKLAYVVACHNGADFDTAHAMGQRYEDANARWRGNYVATIAL